MVASGRAVLCAAALMAAVPAPAGAAAWQLTIRSRGAVPGDTPIVAEIKPAVPPGDYDLRALQGNTGGKAQVFVDAGKTYLATLVPPFPAPGESRFTLARRSEVSPPPCTIRSRGKDLEFLVDGRLLTVYRGGETAKPYYYPLIGPTGASYTRAFPMRKEVAGEDHDHNHQRSFWFTHGNVNGVDFWSSDPLNGSKANFGSIRETSRLTAAGAVVGLIRTTDQWLDHDGRKVLEDERVVRFYNTSATRVIDFDIRLEATAGPVTFGDTKEGMFGLRVASSMDVTHKKGGKITNAEGLHDDDAWGKPSSWVDYTGPVEGKIVGIAILNHPESFRYPTTWHVRTYGLFAANPFGWHDFGMKKTGAYTIPAGESIAFRYRVVLHEDDTPSARVAELFRAYAEPPTVEVQAE
jgi:Methane oxygenase PmoA